jgi:serine/threonine-protein kinase/endoribonuclease IRE1
VYDANGDSIELSPFTFPHSPSRIFTGSKHTSLLTLDLRTGQQLDCFSSFASNLSSPQDCTCDTTDDLLDDLESTSRSNRDILFVGRTDYRLSIHTPGGAPSSSSISSGVAKKGSVQEVIYSTYTPNSFDKPLAEFWTKAGSTGDMWDEDGSPSKKMRVELRHDGVAVGVEQGGMVKWTSQLGNIGIAVYDILLPLSPSTANPILVPQPPFHLPSLFPHIKDSDKYQLLSRPPVTYIASIDLPLGIAATPSPESSVGENDGSLSQPPNHPHLFALSSASYPYIYSAPVPRPGTIANGTFQVAEDQPEKDQLLPYLLDPPPEVPTIDQNGSDPEAFREIIVRPSPVKGWAWWVVGVLSAMGFCILAVIRMSRRPEIKQTASPAEYVDEKTPLLIEPQAIRISEKVVIAEPGQPHASSSSAVAVITPNLDESTTPKKKTNRRRVRGKKKPRNGDAHQDEDDIDEDDKGEGPSSYSLVQGSFGREKPLPELPREMSTTAIADDRDVERLCISDIVIGYGSHGTVVLKGTWGGRPVAVKRLLSDFTRLASQEVKLLQASDDHSNVIRCKCYRVEEEIDMLMGAF